MKKLAGTFTITFNSELSKERATEIIEDIKEAVEQRIAESDRLTDEIGNVSIHVPRVIRLDICP